MGKQLYFYLGFFSAGLLAVPMATGIMGATEQEMRRIAVTLFIAVSVLVFFLVIALFFRGWILRRMFGRAEATLDDVSASLISGVSAATAGDREAATKHAQELVQRGMGWYAWTGFYRWVIATAVALLLAFGAFMGTVLLFEQNRKLGEQTEALRTQTERLTEQTDFMRVQTEAVQAQVQLMSQQTESMRLQNDRMDAQTQQMTLQNELVMLDLVDKLRGQFKSTSTEMSLRDILNEVGVLVTMPVVKGTDDGCLLTWNFEHTLARPASPATLATVEGLARNPLLRGRMLDALLLLTQDDDSAVALSALQVLSRLNPGEELGERWLDLEVTLRGVFVGDLNLDTRALVFLNDTYVERFACESCSLYIERSYAEAEDARVDALIHTVFEGPYDATSALPPIVSVFRDTRPFGDLRVGSANSETVSVVLGDQDAILDRGPRVSTCEALSSLAENAPMFAYQP
ncbi:hypothetical protein KUV51_20270 [Tateyamaria omphalii]|uniref:hypothetical protein n=1 Tax=Tateyamaria omphalii TaxID=299262 RepID=UPI001C992B55|nr:hypothetical protein [Tateyamaria omphalii]MBY5935353.1 hypothetical protein [Tateyamaria omphalii]